MCKTTISPTHKQSKTKKISPKKSTKTMKKQLKVHHTIPKGIYIIQHNPNWKNHALIRNLPNNISQPLKHPTSIDEWIKKIAMFYKKAKKEGRIIVQ